MKRDDKAIHRLMEAYFNGLHHCDLEGLAGVFHPKAVYACSVGQDHKVLDMPAYFEILRQRTSPARLGEARVARVDSIDWISDTLAIVKAHSRMLDRDYRDALTLLWTGGRWRIVAKTFHYEPLAADG